MVRFVFVVVFPDERLVGDAEADADDAEDRLHLAFDDCLDVHVAGALRDEVAQDFGIFAQLKEEKYIQFFS